MSKKSILLVCRRAQGGMKSHLEILIKGLVKANFRVGVAAPEPTLRLPPEVELHPLDIPEIPYPHVLRTSVRTLKDLLEKKDFSIVHTHGYAAGITGRLASIRAPKKALLHTIHNFFPQTSPFLLTGGKLAELWLSQYTHKIITVSEQLKIFLLTIGIKPDKLVTIYNGIDAAGFPPQDKAEARKLLHLSAEERVVGTVARLIPAKGIDLFLQALALLKKTTSLKGVVIGDGPQKFALQELAQQLGLQDTVIFTGHREDVSALFPALDIFILPSRREGFGLTVLESQWLGIPVIAADTGGIREIVEHGENGLLFAAGDFRELAWHMDRLLADEETRTTLAEKGAHSVRLRFTAERMLEET
ncbi:MAG: glycosyltransferase family 4 protein, partial [Clostridia bacterium]|nr:glycosyltransferase family 4 protein [Clostridia bacterium]